MAGTGGAGKGKGEPTWGLSFVYASSGSGALFDFSVGSVPSVAQELSS